MGHSIPGKDDSVPANKPFTIEKTKSISESNLDELDVQSGNFGQTPFKMQARLFSGKLSRNKEIKQSPLKEKAECKDKGNEVPLKKVENTEQIN